MKKSLLALAALSAFAGVAHAESSVELYGILDVAVGTVSKQLGTDGNFPATVNPFSKTTATQSVTGMFNGGISDSRWGLRGTEDLGGGLKAIFTLESGIDAPTGGVNNAAQALVDSAHGANNNSANSSLSGQLFNRQAWVGLSDPTYGTVKFGRNYAPIFDIVVAYDPVQAAQLFSPLGFSGTIGGGGGVSENTRQDNSIKYSNKIGNVNFGAMYKIGGVAGSASAQSAYALNAGYEAGNFGVQVAYQNAKDAIATGSSATAGDVAATVSNTEAYFLAAKYKITSAATIRAGMEHYALSAPSDAMTTTTLPTLFGYAVSGVTNTSTATQANVYFIGGDYDVNSALNIAVGFYDQHANQSTANTSADIYTYSLLADYKFSKRTDVYAGLAYSQYKGDYYNANSNYVSSNGIYAVGIRHKF